ncbi:sensor histidine kinase [Trinickia symbiotica]|uniref:histidine kinase n=2 Tax=Trinickia symbiotica TaxID=863227 RepID=A0A2N7X1H0_9BURK|nr:sensor histidine kinase [Trinickia symbiotica]
MLRPRAIWRGCSHAHTVFGGLMIALPPGGLRNMKWREVMDAVRRRVFAARHNRKDFGAAVVIGQDLERKRITSELHDGLGQALTLIKLTIEDARIRLRGGRTLEARELLDAAVISICEAIGDVRQICNELNPVLLERLGLVASLASLCARVDERVETLSVRFDCGVQDAEVPGNLRADVFRVAQEALTNALRHGSAKTIDLGLHRTERCLSLTIEDDGVGFDTLCPATDPDLDGGLGLIGMKHRVEAAGGTFVVHSSVTGGTLVSAIWSV